MHRTERAALLLSGLLPFEPPAWLVSFFAPRLESAAVYVPPTVFARFALVAMVAPTPVELSLPLLLPEVYWVPLSALLLSAQSFPLTALAVRASQRRKMVESELPYVAMVFFILSHEAYASLPGIFRKIEQLGPEVFPAFYAEAQSLARNLTYGTEGDLAGIERSFRTHPSERLREFIHGHSTALATGRDTHAFVGLEVDRLLAYQDERWRSFGSFLSSLTEVSFILLAVFPVGMQMIAGGISGLRASSMLLLSVILLVAVTCGLIGWLDSVQPVSHDRPLPAGASMLPAVLMLLLMVLYQLGLADSLVIAAAGLAASSAYHLRVRGHLKRIGAGEKEAGVVLHDLAESARAGIELPLALESLARESGRFISMEGELATFSRLLSLGQPPVAAQRRLAHPSWLVRVSFALLSLSFETGGGYEQLDKLALSFRRITDSKGAIRGAVLPFAFLGVMVPAISSASLWFIRSLQSMGPTLSLVAAQGGGSGAGGSIVATAFLAGLIVSKAYSQSLRSMVGVPPLLGSAVFSFLFFGSF